MIWLASLAVLWAVLLRPDWSRVRTIGRFVNDGLSLVLATILLRADAVVQLAPGVEATDKLIAVVRFINAQALIVVLIWLLASLWQIVHSIYRLVTASSTGPNDRRRWLTPRAGARWLSRRNRGEIDRYEAPTPTPVHCAAPTGCREGEPASPSTGIIEIHGAKTVRRPLERLEPPVRTDPVDNRAVEEDERHAPRDTPFDAAPVPIQSAPEHRTRVEHDGHDVYGSSRRSFDHAE